MRIDLCFPKHCEQKVTFKSQTAYYRRAVVISTFCIGNNRFTKMSSKLLFVVVIFLLTLLFIMKVSAYFIKPRFFKHYKAFQVLLMDLFLYVTLWKNNQNQYTQSGESRYFCLDKLHGKMVDFLNLSNLLGTRIIEIKLYESVGSRHFTDFNILL